MTVSQRIFTDSESPKTVAQAEAVARKWGKFHRSRGTIEDAVVAERAKHMLPAERFHELVLEGEKIR